MRLLITPLAAHDLEEIGDYIARDNPIRAASFIAELRAQCEKICLNPQAIDAGQSYLKVCVRAPTAITSSLLSQRRTKSPSFASFMARATCLTLSIHRSAGVRTPSVWRGVRLLVTPMDAEGDNPRTRRRAAMRRRVFVCATSGHLFMRRTRCFTYSEFSL